MTVPSSTSRDQQAGNGVTTVFTVPFRILADTHLQVLATTLGVTTELALTTDYTVDDVGDPNTTVTFVVAPANGTTLTFLRDVPATQETDYAANDSFPAETHENALDKLTMLVQQLNEIAGNNGRVLRIPAQVSGVSTEMPVPEPSVLWGWNAAANAPRYYTPAEIATEVTYAEYHAQHFTAVAAQTQFTLAADPGAIGNLDVSIDGVVQVPNVDFTYSGTVVTFATPMVGGEVVLFRYGEALPVGTINSSQVVPTLGEVYNVREARFGAVANGINDDSAAIQLAVNAAAAAGGGTVYLPAGTYKVGATITINSAGVRILGAGMWNTILTRSADYGDTILFTGNDATGAVLSDAGLAGVAFKSTGLTTSGAHVHLNGVARFTLTDVYMLQGFIGIKANGVTASYFSNIYLVFTSLFGGSATGRRFMSFASAAATYGHPSSGDVFVSNYNVRGTVSAQNTEYGIYIESGDGIWFANGHIGNASVANIMLNAADPNEHIGLIFVINTMVDEGALYSLRFAGNSQIGRNIQFSNCIFKGAGLAQEGIGNNVNATFQNVQFNNCFVTEFTQRGINLTSTGLTNFDFNNMQVRGNSYGSAGTYSGCVLSGVKHFRLIGGKYGGHNVNGHLVGDQAYGISIGLTVARILISGVDASSNTTGDFQINGASAGEVTINGCIGQTALTAASASTLTLPELGSAIHVTGAVQIDNIQVSRADRMVTLIFDSNPLVTDAGNKKLAGPFAATADDTLTLIFDLSTATWFEVARSVN